MNLAEAYQQYKAADHLLNVTFPLVKDPKLLLGILQNIHTILETGIRQITNTGIVPNLPQTSILNLRNEGIPSEYITLYITINNIVEQHKKSPIEFRKNDCFVICSDEYALTTITRETIRDYLQKTKQFLLFVSQK